MKKLIVFFLLVLLVVLFIFMIFRRPSIDPVEKTYLYFDTFIRISLYPADREPGEKLFSMIDEEFERIQGRFGYGNSAIASLLAERNEPLILSGEDRVLLKRALAFCEQTGGAFDITVGLLEQVWGFKDGDPHVPLKGEIADALRHTGYEHVILRDSTLFLKKDVLIDLGGISKGHAVDRAVHLLREREITAGLVDAGGDLRVFGNKPDGSRWIIGIRHPEERGAILATFKIDSGAVATSGNYERSFVEDSTLYHHIIDPRTGYPAALCVSVTILADDAVTADALATAVFVLGPEKGMELVEDLNRVEGVIVFRRNGDLEIITSRGISLQ
jgi:thiamine biosynthesis lipoprotein